MIQKTVTGYIIQWMYSVSSKSLSLENENPDLFLTYAPGHMEATAGIYYKNMNFDDEGNFYEVDTTNVQDKANVFTCYSDAHEVWKFICEEFGDPYYLILPLWE